MGGYVMLTEQILNELQLFIDNNCNDFIVCECSPSFSRKKVEADAITPHELENFIEGNKEPTFSQTLLKFIDKNGLNDSQVYKKAGMDRRHFSKIRSNPEYKPTKNTVVSLALALELDKSKTNELLSSAGYSLSKSEVFDLIILFCIEKKIYKIDDVNSALCYFSLKPIGGVLR